MGSKWCNSRWPTFLTWSYHCQMSRCSPSLLCLGASFTENCMRLHAASYERRNVVPCGGYLGSWAPVIPLGSHASEINPVTPWYIALDAQLLQWTTQTGRLLQANVKSESTIRWTRVGSEGWRSLGAYRSYQCEELARKELINSQWNLELGAGSPRGKHLMWPGT